ncbi:unnamed protein product [Allacma fusca]|uniref:3'-5' exonuclease domain-containing protein n=1 Tax=Allacma fusca TaxID=39272 RepID=A0A8J2PEV1_9HEXA|nr:unnamed protein product [Allacma fusca]
MLEDIWQQDVVAMDYEFHKENSHNGLIALIQVTTKNFNYIIDPFQTRPVIMKDLVPKTFDLILKQKISDAGLQTAFNITKTKLKQTFRQQKYPPASQMLSKTLFNSLCRCCLGLGHLGWQCPYDNEKGNLKTYMNRSENYESKIYQGFRRALKWFNKKGQWPKDAPIEWFYVVLNAEEQHEDPLIYFRANMK